MTKSEPMTKKIALLLFLAAGVTAAAAQDPLPAQLVSCLEITGVLQRLACYDRVAHSVSRTSLATPRGVPAEKPIARAVVPAAGLGSERLPHAAPVRRASEMVAGVAGISYDPRGRFTVTLDNGQVWRQLAGDTAVLQGAGVSTVRISRGALGSYDLNVEGRNATYRVLRLQ
jgi:hypothetical protein